jgi:ParB family transcriptional regulator, chromosome partitioning protein
MSKLDEMRRGAGANVGESMGAGRIPGQAMHGAYPVSGIPARLQGIAKSKDAAEIPVGKIVRDPDQPRQEFDEAELARLAESLKQRGQLQPIRVRWDEGRGAYVLICGERRWRAAQLAGRATMSCIIVEEALGPADLLAIQLLENCMREDLKPVEQARAFKALMDQHGWTATQVGRELGIDQSSVSRTLKLLELPGPVQEMVEQGAMSAATAYEVSKLDDPDAQREVAGRIVAEDLSRAEAIEAVREASGRSSKGGRAKGRGAKAKPRKVTSRTGKVDGYKLTAENQRGIVPDALVAALRKFADSIEAEMQGRGEAAA